MYIEKGSIKEKIEEQKDKFDFGVSIYPTLYSDVLYIKDKELDTIFKVSNIETPIEGSLGNTRL
mgnify:CR=1 FL=1